MTGVQHTNGKFRKLVYFFFSLDFFLLAVVRRRVVITWLRNGRPTKGNPVN